MTQNHIVTDIKEKLAYAQYIWQQKFNPRVTEKGDPSESIPVPFFYFTKKGSESKRWNKFQVDNSAALLIQGSFHMDTLTTDITERKEKQHYIACHHSVCHCFWHLCLLLCIDFSPLPKEKKPALFIHNRVNSCSLICDERASGLTLNKLRLEVKFTYSSLWHPPHPILAVSLLQAVLHLSSNLTPQPLAPHPELLHSEGNSPNSPKSGVSTASF